MSYVEILKELDLSKNEALIYEALVDKGELSVSEIAKESGVNRRNVYDTLNRLLEKGLVFEIKQSRESRFKAAHPKKLREILKEKEEKLDSVLADLEYMYQETPREEEVYIFRGMEGWKNFLSLQVSENKDIYVIGGKGVFGDEKIRPYVEQMYKQMKEQGMKYHILFDQVVKKENRPALELYNKESYRFLPKGYNTSSAIVIFSDYAVIFGDLSSGRIEERSSLTVIKNPHIADSLRTWFKLLWDLNASQK